MMRLALKLLYLYSEKIFVKKKFLICKLLKKNCLIKLL